MIYFFKGFYLAQKEKEIINNGKIIRSYIQQALVREDKQAANSWLELLAKLNTGQAWLIDNNGFLLLSYPHLTVETPLKFLKHEYIFQGNIVTQRVESVYFERPMLLIALPLLFGDINYGLLIFSSVEGINSTIRQVRLLMFYSSLIAIVLGIVVAYTWSKKLSNPLIKISKVANELSKGKFGKTIAIDSNKYNREVNTLAYSINYMSKTLEKTVNNLVQERNKLKYVLSGMEEGVLAINKEGEIILINQSAKRLLNLKHKQLKGKMLNTLLNKKEVLDVFSKALNKREFVQSELFIRQDKRVLLNCTVIYEKENKFWGVVGLFQDISERWRFEQLQNDFVANVSHELKTPLSSIKGAAEILFDGVVDSSKKRLEYIEMIISESNRLEGLVNKILSLAEFDGNSSFKMEKIDLKQLLYKVAKVFKKIIKAKDITLELEIAKEKLLVWANEEKLQQVLLNLLDNAFKFSSQGKKIILGAYQKEEKIKVYIKDQGVGIANNQLENIWERFYKIDKARSPEKDGSGLGLAIVKQIIRGHKGEVFVESKLGQGSVFGFYLNKYNKG